MEIRERIARAICRAWFYCDLDKPDGLEHWKKNKAKCMAEAEATLKLIGEDPEIMAMLRSASGQDGE